MTKEEFAAEKLCINDFIRNRFVVKIDQRCMDLLGVKEGQVIEVQARRSTYVKCQPLNSTGFPKEQSENIIRMSELTRINAGNVAIGDTVLVKAAVHRHQDEIGQASRVVVAPTIEDMSPIDERMLTDVLEGVSLAVGDYFWMPVLGDRNKIGFVVKQIDSILQNPSPVCIITSKTTTCIVDE